MQYEVKTIKNEQQVEECPLFEVSHYQWICKRTPKTYGRMGYLPKKGLVVHMISEEKEPKAVYVNDGDMVCEDSAMEVFLAFADKGEEITNDSLYLNFEVNSNAALYAKYGYGRIGRKFFEKKYREKIQCTTTKNEEQWELTLLIPEEILQEICHVDFQKKDLLFYCNFYKISEEPAIQHYGSYSPIKSETPNFHLPIFFAKARLV